ncbi:hypothetical protein SAMN04488494_2613 [Xylanibacter ruminicola]|uniref:Lipoprotein n=1 Tax=Xylanibacter ruminicola TaxID=839 RepID=A0A1M7LLN1_XYLRU|nr:hypothetical protein [Xylanibacter ruminicola]SHM78906.1 hypothetical protein SAMN04488494_2613 [Xylanibacter ruminicola]
MTKKTNFGFIAIVTTLLVTIMLSSCSHDKYLYSEEKVEQNYNEKYAAAFEKAFGKVGSNVDWGFSSKRANTRALTRAAGTYASYKGNLQPTITFPTDCDASNFLDAVPAGVNQLSPNGAGAGTYFIDAETQAVSTWSGASTIYVTGTVDLSDGDTNAVTPKFAPDYRSEIYLIQGATLRLGEASATTLNVAGIYIAEGATLETTGVLTANNSTKVYNHGTIRVGTFATNQSGMLYNVGTLQAANVNAESNNSRIVNDGIINSTTVTVNAGAVQNNAEWTVTDTTKVNSNNSGWVNNGHWTTNYYAYIGGSENVINNCFLEVIHDFEMNISSAEGAFKIDAGCGVLTENFYGGRDSSTDAVSGPFKILMGANAVFVVEKTAQFESGTAGNAGYGIYGISPDGYAVFQAKDIVRDAYLASINSHGAITYGGNLYISAETHFAQGDCGNNQTVIYEQDGFSLANNLYAAGFKSGKPNITIPETPCNPSFIGGSTPLYRVIAEDLSASEAGDFDFNDVVFDVVKAEGGKTTLRLICAGGVLPLRVMGIEVHGLFGETTPNEKGEYKMYNTGAGPNVDPVEFEITGEYTTPEQIKNIRIEVSKNGSWMELQATRGEAACKILVDDTFVPVPERRNIANENKKFTDYVQGTFVDEFWWK